MDDGTIQRATERLLEALELAASTHTPVEGALGEDAFAATAGGAAVGEERRSAVEGQPSTGGGREGDVAMEGGGGDSNGSGGGVGGGGSGGGVGGGGSIAAGAAERLLVELCELCGQSCGAVKRGKLEQLLRFAGKESGSRSSRGDGSMSLPDRLRNKIVMAIPQLVGFRPKDVRMVIRVAKELVDCDVQLVVPVIEALAELPLTQDQASEFLDMGTRVLPIIHDGDLEGVVASMLAAAGVVGDKVLARIVATIQSKTSSRLADALAARFQTTLDATLAGPSTMQIHALRETCGAVVGVARQVSSLHIDAQAVLIRSTGNSCDPVGVLVLAYLCGQHDSAVTVKWLCSLAEGHSLGSTSIEAAILAVKFAGDAAGAAWCRGLATVLRVIMEAAYARRVKLIERSTGRARPGHHSDGGSAMGEVSRASELIVVLLRCLPKFAEPMCRTLLQERIVKAETRNWASQNRAAEVIQATARAISVCGAQMPLVANALDEWHGDPLSHSDEADCAMSLAMAKLALTQGNGGPMYHERVLVDTLCGQGQFVRRSAMLATGLVVAGDLSTSKHEQLLCRRRIVDVVSSICSDQRFGVSAALLELVGNRPERALSELAARRFWCVASALQMCAPMVVGGATTRKQVKNLSLCIDLMSFFGLQELQKPCALPSGASHEGPWLGTAAAESNRLSLDRDAFAAAAWRALVQSHQQGIIVQITVPAILASCAAVSSTSADAKFPRLHDLASIQTSVLVSYARCAALARSILLSVVDAHETTTPVSVNDVTMPPPPPLDGVARELSRTDRFCHNQRNAVEALAPAHVMEYLCCSGRLARFARLCLTVLNCRAAVGLRDPRVHHASPVTDSKEHVRATPEAASSFDRHVPQPISSLKAQKRRRQSALAVRVGGSGTKRASIATPSGREKDGDFVPRSSDSDASTSEEESEYFSDEFEDSDRVRRLIPSPRRRGDTIAVSRTRTRNDQQWAAFASVEQASRCQVAVERIHEALHRQAPTTTLLFLQLCQRVRASTVDTALFSKLHKPALLKEFPFLALCDASTRGQMHMTCRVADQLECDVGDWLDGLILLYQQMLPAVVTRVSRSSAQARAREAVPDAMRRVIQQPAEHTMPTSTTPLPWLDELRRHNPHNGAALIHDKLTLAKQLVQLGDYQRNGVLLPDEGLADCAARSGLVTWLMSRAVCLAEGLDSARKTAAEQRAGEIRDATKADGSLPLTSRLPEVLLVLHLRLIALIVKSTRSIEHMAVFSRVVQAAAIGVCIAYADDCSTASKKAKEFSLQATKSGTDEEEGKKQRDCINIVSRCVAKLWQRVSSGSIAAAACELLLAVAPTQKAAVRVGRICWAAFHSVYPNPLGSNVSGSDIDALRSEMDMPVPCGTLSAPRMWQPYTRPLSWLNASILVGDYETQVAVGSLLRLTATFVNLRSGSRASAGGHAQSWQSFGSISAAWPPHSEHMFSFVKTAMTVTSAEETGSALISCGACIAQFLKNKLLVRADKVARRHRKRARAAKAPGVVEDVFHPLMRSLSDDTFAGIYEIVVVASVVHLAGSRPGLVGDHARLHRSKPLFVTPTRTIGIGFGSAPTLSEAEEGPARAMVSPFACCVEIRRSLILIRNLLMMYREAAECGLLASSTAATLVAACRRLSKLVATKLDDAAEWRAKARPAQTNRADIKVAVLVPLCHAAMALVDQLLSMFGSKATWPAGSMPAAVRRSLPGVLRDCDNLRTWLLKFDAAQHIGAFSRSGKPVKQDSFARHEVDVDSQAIKQGWTAMLQMPKSHIAVWAGKMKRKTQTVTGERRRRIPRLSRPMVAGGSDTDDSLGAWSVGVSGSSDADSSDADGGCDSESSNARSTTKRPDASLDPDRFVTTGDGLGSSFQVSWRGGESDSKEQLSFGAVPHALPAFEADEVGAAPGRDDSDSDDESDDNEHAPLIVQYSKPLS